MKRLLIFFLNFKLKGYVLYEIKMFFYVLLLIFLSFFVMVIVLLKIVFMNGLFFCVSYWDNNNLLLD